MIDFKSKNFQLIWGAWILLLGISLIFMHAINAIGSIFEYLNAFLILDMPSSWCPTFLTLFGVATISKTLVDNPRIKRIFTILSWIAGVVLLPVGIYVTITFSITEVFSLDFMYIYAQTIHISEVLTGLFTVFLLVKLKK